MSNQTPEIPASLCPKSRIQTQRTRARWRSLVDDFTTSGLTKAAFCRKRGIAISGLYRWQKAHKINQAYAGLALEGLQSKHRHKILAGFGEVNAVFASYTLDSFDDYEKRARIAAVYNIFAFAALLTVRS